MPHGFRRIAVECKKSGSGRPPPVGIAAAFFPDMLVFGCHHRPRSDILFVVSATNRRLELHSRDPWLGFLFFIDTPAIYSLSNLLP